MSALSDRVSEAAEPLAGSPDDYDSLLATISTRGSPISSTPRAVEPSERTAEWELGESKKRFRADFDLR